MIHCDIRPCCQMNVNHVGVVLGRMIHCDNHVKLVRLNYFGKEWNKEE